MSSQPVCRWCRVLFSQSHVLFVAAILLSLFAAEHALAIGPLVRFANASRTVISHTSGIRQPNDVAVDSEGNLYIADTFNNRVLQETLANGTYTQSVVASGLNTPAGVAVDGSGNVFIADSGNNRVLKETPSSGGFTQTVVASGLSQPYGVALDASGNVYVADAGSGRILLESPSAGSYIQSTLVSGLTLPFGVAVDGAGNLYIAGRGQNAVLKETLSGGSYTESVITNNVVAPFKVMVDASGTVYAADTYGQRVLKEVWDSQTGSYAESQMINLGDPMGMAEDAGGNLYVAVEGESRIAKVQTTAPDFGSAVVGNSISTVVTLTFAFNRSGSLGALPVIYTMGASGLDFQDAGTGTCNSNGPSHSYNAGDLCSVDVRFTPLFPGARYGAAELQDSNGQLLASSLVYGLGLGPRLAFIPPLQTTVASDLTSGLSNPVGVAVDGNNNLYITDWGNDRIVLLPWSNGTYGSASTIGYSLAGPTDMAVDGAGNVYIDDYDHSRVLLEFLSAGNYIQSEIGSGMFTNTGVAVDGAGNVYVADLGNQRVLLETASSAGYTQSVIDSALTSPYGIAIDSLGNIYLADQGADQIVKDTLLNGVYTQSVIASGLARPQAVAVDAAGNVYFTNTRWNQLAMLPWGASGYGTKMDFGVGLSWPQGMAFDASGNLFVGDSNNNRVVKEDFSQTPAIDFGSIMLGQTSAAQTVMLANSGTSALTFTSFSVPSHFHLQTDCSTSTPLAPGSTCSLNITFTPQSAGTSTGALTVTSSDNPSGTDISLQGAGQAVATQLGFSASIPDPVSVGGNLGTVTVNVLDGSGNLFNSTATITLQISGPQGFSAYQSSSDAVAGSASFDLSALAFTIIGQYTITASSNGLTSAQGSFAVSSAAAFGMTPASSSMTVASGASGTVNITITPTGGFTGDVTLSCSNLPVYASCSFNPPSVHADGSNRSLSSIVTIATTAAPAIAIRHAHLPLLWAAWGGTAFFGFFLIPAGKLNLRGLRHLALGLLLLCLMVLPGCGSSRRASQAVPVTPPGVYSVTLNATSGGVTHSSVINLTVN